MSGTVYHAIMKTHFKKNYHALFISALLASLASCCQKKLVNLSVAKEQVEDYYEDGKYDQDLDTIADKTRKYLSSLRVKPHSLVIFDIDDTVLLDYDKEKSISFGYIPKLSHDWILQANAPAIPQIKELYDYVIQRGFRVVFLTGRKHDEYDATIENLKKEGFTTFDKLIVRQPHELKMSAKEYKTQRRKELEQQGYSIVACIGDQWSDLYGGHAGYKVKVPNFKYRIA